MNALHAIRCSRTSAGSLQRVLKNQLSNAFNNQRPTGLSDGFLATRDSPTPIAKKANAICKAIARADVIATSLTA
jgi:hypothetical protein